MRKARGPHITFLACCVLLNCCLCKTGIRGASGFRRRSLYTSRFVLESGYNSSIEDTNGYPPQDTVLTPPIFDGQDVNTSQNAGKSKNLVTPFVAILVLVASFVLFAIAATILIVVGRKRRRYHSRRQRQQTKQPTEPTENEERDRSEGSTMSQGLAFPLPRHIAGAGNQNMTKIRDLRAAQQVPMEVVNLNDDESDVSSVASSLSNSMRLLRQFEEDEIHSKRSSSPVEESPIVITE